MREPDKLSCLSLDVPLQGLLPPRVCCHQANHFTSAEHFKKQIKAPLCAINFIIMPHHRHSTRERSTTHSLSTWLQLFILADEEYLGPKLCRFFPNGSEQSCGERQQKKKSPFSTCFYWPIIYLFMVKTLVWYMAPGLERQCSIHVSKSVNSNMVLSVSDLHITETLLISM